MNHFVTLGRWAKVVLEAVLKVGIFLTYMVGISKMKEIHRVFEYHGAEHKTIACYEAGDPLTVENVRKYTRFHPRCGTSFLILVVIVSVFLYSVLPWGSIGLRVLFKLLLLPLVMGISYELLKWCGRSDNLATRIIRQPGIWVQHLTVFEPDDSMIEVAIAAVTLCCPRTRRMADGNCWFDPARSGAGRGSPAFCCRVSGCRLRCTGAVPRGSRAGCPPFRPGADHGGSGKAGSLCTRREQREPLQYLCGIWSFLDFDLAVGPGVLCPRADTEVVAEAAANSLTGIAAPRVLDLCAGTGCLGLGVKRFCPAAQVTCVEKAGSFCLSGKELPLRPERQGGQTEDLLEPTAFEQADAPAFDWGPALNALRAKAKPAYAVQPVEGDLFTYWQGLPEGQLDLIVSNPPYLTAEEMRHLQPEVAQEPAMALEAGKDGLVFYRALAEHYQNALRPGGALVLEIGWQQRQAVAALLAANGWADIECRKDFGGNDRCMIAHRPEK